MKINKRILIGIVISIMLTAVIGLATNSDIVYGITGFFTKAFDKTLSPGEYYERNITVRKYYNLSVRFQKEGSTGYLGFTDNDSVVVLEDANGADILTLNGVSKGRIYVKVTNYELASVASVSAQSISDYEDVVDQPVNDTVLSFIGTNAYLTVHVHQKVYETSNIAGYIVDDLTGEFVSDVGVLAFDDGADPVLATAVVQNTSGIGGMYQLALQLSSSKALDVYVEGYDVG